MKTRREMPIAPEGVLNGTLAILPQDRAPRVFRVLATIVAFPFLALWMLAGFLWPIETRWARRWLPTPVRWVLGVMAIVGLIMGLVNLIRSIFSE